MANNLIDKKNCYGCGMCEIICPQKIIKIERNEDGFYAPKLMDATKCVNCGLCEKICPFSNADIVAEKNPENAYAVFSKNKETLKTCSSGGIGYEIGKKFLEKGYKICGVRYNYDLNRAEHFMVNNIEELELTKGSKYIQSYTVNGFREFNSDGKWVVFGTPCQIDSVRRWIKFKNIEENYVLIDFFCHGTPSYLLWEKYLEYQSKKHKIENFIEINFRDKTFGWHDLAISLENENKKIKNRLKRFDLFYNFFLSDVCLNSCCYENCKFKKFASSADLRIGDFWGKKYANNSEGVSGVLVFSEKGQKLIEELRDRCIVNVEQKEAIASGQMKKNLKTPRIRKQVIKDLAKKNSSLRFIFFYAVFPKIAFIAVPKMIFNRILNLIKK